MAVASLFASLLRAGFRHRVEPAGMEGMAAQQPPRSQPSSAQVSVALQCFHCVLGTARMEAATRTQQWADEAFVESQEEQDW
jgi:hypothetical protein